MPSSPPPPQKKTFLLALSPFSHVSFFFFPAGVRLRRGRALLLGNIGPPSSHAFAAQTVRSWRGGGKKKRGKGRRYRDSLCQWDPTNSLAYTNGGGIVSLSPPPKKERTTYLPWFPFLPSSIKGGADGLITLQVLCVYIRMMHASIWVGGESKEGGGGGRDNFFGTPSLSLSLGARSTTHAPQIPGKNILKKSTIVSR